MKKILLFLIMIGFISFESLLAFDITNMTDNNISVDISNQDGTALGFTVANDNKVYIAGLANDSFFQYDMSTDNDLSTATYSNKSFNFSAQDSGIRDIAISPDGTKFYSQSFNGTIFQYTLNTPYEIDTASYDNVFLSIGVGDTQGFEFNNDGSKLYVIERQNSTVREYDLSISFDISSSTFVNSFDFRSILEGTSEDPSRNDMVDFRISLDGSKAFFFNSSTQKIYQLTMTNPFDITSINVSTFVTYFIGTSSTQAFDFNTDGTKFYYVDYGIDEVIELDTNFNPEPPTYSVDLATNNSPYIDFIYTDNDVSIRTTSIDTIIDNNEPWSITSNISNLGPFSFNNWFDLDNSQIFTNDRTFNIVDPDRNYNLIADYTLNDFVELSFNSNHPATPNLTFNSNTIELDSFTINQPSFNNWEHPEGYEFEIVAPTTNIGFYEFDYWFDNSTNSVLTTNSSVTSSGLTNFNLTATYSLPSEYQINLSLSTDIGFITFQLGNLNPITGSTINTTISSGDNWTATAPLGNNDFIFNNWLDLNTFDSFSDSLELNVTNTNNNYNLQAQYLLLYDVFWDSDGGTPISSQKVIIGDFINPPTDPTKPNFAFGGWYEEGDVNQTPVNYPYQVTEDVTFVAIWLDTYTLTFDTNGGGSINPVTYVASETPEVVTPSRFGYTFEGWFTDDGTFQNAYDFTDPITQDTTIHAKWSFGSDRDAELSLTTFLDDNDLGDRFSQIIVMITIYVFVNIVIMIYQAPLIVTLILNFIVTSLFMILGWIAIWLVVVIFMALFGFLYFTSSGRGLTE